MIWESVYWKEDLLRHAKKLRRSMKQKQWQDSSFANTEKCIMLGFYSIRKLVEARKLSDKVITRKYKIKIYPATGKPVTLFNWHKLEELYDFNKMKHGAYGIRFLCNQVIHSYVFTISFGRNDDLNGFYFSSDHQRNKSLYFIRVLDVIRMFELGGHDYPNYGSWKWNPKTQDYDVTQKMIKRRNN